MQRRIVSSGMVMRLNDATYGQILSEVGFFQMHQTIHTIIYESFILNEQVVQKIIQQKNIENDFRNNSTALCDIGDYTSSENQNAIFWYS